LVFIDSQNRVNKTASLIKCRILNSQEGQFSWTNYRALSNAIAACGERVESVHTAVQVGRKIDVPSHSSLWRPNASAKLMTILAKHSSFWRLL
jgi:hypothetical protein